MKYEEALIRFSDYYKDRYTLEFPTIFSLYDFRDKSILEIGSGKEGYFIKEALKLTKKITASDISEKILRILRKNVRVKTEVCNAENLPFSDNSFDIVFSRWVIQHVNNLEKAVKEMCRVASHSVIIIFPSEHGDETKLLEIKFHDKFELRRERRENIKRSLSECGLKVKERRKSLRFLFPDTEETLEMFCALEFKNKLSKDEKLKLNKFLLSRTNKDGIHFTQGASFICGYK